MRVHIKKKIILTYKISISFRRKLMQTDLDINTSLKKYKIKKIFFTKKQKIKFNMFCLLIILFDIAFMSEWRSLLIKRKLIKN